MSRNFVKIATVSPDIKVADPLYNAEKILELIKEAYEEKADIIVTPELCLTGYTCCDLFAQAKLIDSAEKALSHIRYNTQYKNVLIAIGMPYRYNCKLYNVMTFINKGKIVGMVPKMNIPNYGEFYEARHFEEGFSKPVMAHLGDNEFPFGSNLLFKANQDNQIVVAAEVCEDLWVPDSPSIRHAMNGAIIILNASASDSVVGKASYRSDLIRMQSAKLACAYAYANIGSGESTQDLVFDGHCMIAENGSILSESRRFSLQKEDRITMATVDVEKLMKERMRMNTYHCLQEESYDKITFDMQEEEAEDTHEYQRTPFIPKNNKERIERCNEILTIQALGLRKRMEHIGCKEAVIGISGGLDSTLALLVTASAFDMLGIPRENIMCITMPCFGTTDRTYNNACELTRLIGATLKEINIGDSVTQHLKDIGHPMEILDVSYENAQARERTQILMDYANMTNGLVVGTGDLSELALGWCTYNGDHMSMYAVNAGIPKTLVRYLVASYALSSSSELKRVLEDILDTPVSPELLPPEDGKITQKTEDKIGPYELHDFYLYYMLRFGYSPARIYDMAIRTFEGIYDKEAILKWMKVFYGRFFSQQFKRSCIPDGPKVGTIALSPRGDLRMPSDASSNIWMKELDEIAD